MRIIGGSARGRRLFAPEGNDTRPTADRVRESVFNILGARVCGARVLDLFAGSGALALEAVSRGAHSAVLVDSGRAACAVIERNVALMRAQDKARLLRMDYRAALERLGGDPFSLVFLDPPYRMEEAYAQAARLLHARGLLAERAVLVMEHDARRPLRLDGAFEIFDERRYGAAQVAFVRAAPGAKEGEEEG